ncbi:hypothetical protein K438DRAFT_257958 [Mycena galopus ATCC 62051]|nr:hypothetical protein K438DRAFT_257958 [Mycena galopus ATCC 62051]
MFYCIPVTASKRAVKKLTPFACETRTARSGRLWLLLITVMSRHPITASQPLSFLPSSRLLAQRALTFFHFNLARLLLSLPAGPFVFFLNSRDLASIECLLFQQQQVQPLLRVR